MNRFAALLVASALTALIANPVFAEATPAAESKPAAVEAVQAPAATAAPAVSIAQAPAATATPATAAGTVKIGYVDLEKVASTSKSGKAAADALKSRSGKLKAKIEARQKQIEKDKAAIEARLATMSQKDRAAKANEFQKKLEDYQKLVRSSEEEMMKAQDKATSELYQKIQKASKEYARSNGYVAMLEKKGVLFMADSIDPEDVSEEIAKLIDQKPTAGKK